MSKMFSVKRLFMFIIFFLLTHIGNTQNISVNADSAVKYILSYQKSNGGFGPVNMEYTDVAWTYPAVHALQILGATVPKNDSCYINGGKSFMAKEGWKNGPWYWSLHQKAKLYEILGKNGPLEENFPEGISLNLQFKIRRTYLESPNYDKGEFFDMASLWNVVEAVNLMNGKVENPLEIKDYITNRQSANGGFCDMLGEYSLPENNKAHIIVAHDAVMTLKGLGFSVPNSQNLSEWVRACQTKEGGFRWSPDNQSYSNQPDVWYTWAAIRILQVLGENPVNKEACLKWLNKLQNADGGFGDRTSWNSRIYSTYYAVDAIGMLTGNVQKGIFEKKIDIQNKNIPEGVYSIFQAQHKTPSGGTEMVDAIVAMKINFIGVKTTEKEVIESNGMSEVVKKAREYAKEKSYPLEIVDCPENYAHRLVWFSGMNGDHCSNMLVLPGMTEKEKQSYLELYYEGLKGHPWQDFEQKVIRPAFKMGTLFYPELDFTMMNAYMVYDEGLDGHVGYNAVPAAHFNNIDWVRHFPYKERWLGHLPMIADGDAHGDIEKWTPNLEMFRNVFIAKSYHFKDYIDASVNGRSVCVIKMPDSNEIRYYGSPESVDYLKKHLDEWKWWN